MSLILSQKFRDLLLRRDVVVETCVTV